VVKARLQVKILSKNHNPFPTHMKTKIRIALAAIVFTSFAAMAQTLPQTAKSYLQKSFPKEKVSRVERDDNKYEVHLSSSYELEFSSSGKILKLDGNGNMIPASILPAKINAYLKKNYEGEKIEKIELESNGYEVSLSNDLEAKFDKSGNFRKTDN